MRLTKLGVNRDSRTVVILGAGATAGARLSTRAPLGRMFVDGDFFDQLQYFAANAAADKFRADARDFLKYLSEQYGHSRHGLEAIFAELDVTRQFATTTNVKRRGPRSREFDRRVDQLTRLIVDTLRYSIGAQPEALPTCDRHAALLRSLGVEDAVISFNYDLLADRALRAGAGSKFKPEESYGFAPQAVDKDWAPSPRPGAPFKNHVELLKPHGSLNWRNTPTGVEVVKDELAVLPPSVALVPPQYLKRFEDEPFASIWRNARRVLRSAQALVIVGYSLPSSDIFTAAALRLEVHQLDLLCIANPDPIARERILAVLRSALRPETAVVFFDNFAELAERFGARTDREYYADHEDHSWLTEEIDSRIYKLVPKARESLDQGYDEWRNS